MKALMMLLPTVLLIGCGSPAPKYVWQNAYVSDGEGQQQFYIDQGQCTALAQQTVQVPHYVQPAQSGTVTSFSGYSVGSGVFRGQMRTQPSGQANGVLEGVYQARAEELARQRVIDARNAQQSVMRGCMASRGWSLQPVSE